MDKFVIRRPKAEINASHAQRHIVLQEISTDRISSTNIVKNEKVKKDVADANSMDDSWSKSDALKENCCDAPQRKMTPSAKVLTPRNTPPSKRKQVKSSEVKESNKISEHGIKRSRISEHLSTPNSDDVICLGVNVTPMKMKRRYVPENSATTSGVSGFPTISDPAVHRLLCVDRFDSKPDCLILTCHNLSGTQAESSQVTVRVFDNWREFWYDVGCVIRIIAPMEIDKNVFEVSSEQGLIIVEPETLLSCTTMASLLFCPRKALFSDRFKGSCSSYAMLLGNVVHDLFQRCILNRPKKLTMHYLFNEYRIHHLANVCVELIAVGEKDLSRFEKELREYLINVCTWISHYVPSKFSPKKRPILSRTSSSEKTGVEELSVKFGRVMDIEDNIWCPTIGVKGKIDISFQPKDHDEIVPLELKTGKPHAAEHLSQVALYAVMLSETEERNAGRILPGYLLYMKTNTLRQIVPREPELKGILQMRNRHAVPFSLLDVDSFSEPLQSTRPCGYCDHATTCALVNRVSSDRNFQKSVLSDGDTLPMHRRRQNYSLSAEMREFLHCKIEHLSDADIHYANYWMRRVMLDWQRAKEITDTKRIFRNSPEEREANGTCLANLRLVDISRLDAGRRLLKFQRLDGKSFDKPCPFVAGQMAVISGRRAFAVFLEPVFAVDDSSIVVLTEKLMLKADASADVYCVDRYQSATLFALLLGNLAMLMERNDAADKVRSLIIGDRRSPHFRNLQKCEVSAFSEVKTLVKRCQNQVRAVTHSMMADDFLLIDGGADERLQSELVNTVTAIVKCQSRLDRSLLLVAHFNSTVTDLLRALSTHFPTDAILRVGGESRTSKAEDADNDLSGYTLSARLKRLSAQCSGDSTRFFDETKRILLETKIVLATCSAISSHSLFSSRFFDICLVFNADSLPDPSIVRPLLQANAFILVGNLAETAEIEAEPVENSYDCSLMKRLAVKHPKALIRLELLEPNNSEKPAN